MARGTPRGCVALEEALKRAAERAAFCVVRGSRAAATAAAVRRPAAARGGSWAVARGALVATITRDEYEELGLPARRATDGESYRVDVDLRAKCWREGRPLHDRVLGRLRASRDGGCVSAPPVEWAVACVNDGCEDGPLAALEGVERRQCALRRAFLAARSGEVAAYDARMLRRVPHSQGDVCAAGDVVVSGDERLDSGAAAALFAWFGEVALAAEDALRERESGDGLAQAALPESPTTLPGAGTVACEGVDVHRLGGCVGGGVARELLEAARVAVDDGSAPWAALCARGFAGAPVALDGAPVAAAGDSGYALVVLPDGQFVRFDWADGAEA